MAEYEDNPNILLLLTDQERYDLTGPRDEEYGLHEHVETPNMDRLSEEGMRFDNAYTPIGICTSARASLMTGQYPHNHGMLNNCHEDDAVEKNLPDTLTTFSEILDEQGYDNTYIGKWHIGQDQRPENFGFEYIGGGDSHHDSEDSGFIEYLEENDLEEYKPDNIELEDKIETENGTIIAAKKPVPKQATHTHYLAEKTIEQLEKFADDENEEYSEPFFHRADFPGPHHPYIVPEDYADRYDPEDVKRWPNFDDNYEDKPAVQEQYLWKRGVEDFDWNTWSEAAAKYFGFVTFIDDEIGRILDAADDLGLEDDTAVFKTADHGDFTGSHRQFNKGPMMYEETYHIPLVVRWPGKTDSGTASDEYVGLHDLMPTFVEMAGEELTEEIDGESIVPILEGGTPDDWRESMFSEYHGDEFNLFSQRMVVKDDYKMILNPGMIELYDLENDPFELDNQAEESEYRQVVAELSNEMANWMEGTEDSWREWNTQVLRRRADTLLNEPKIEVEAGEGLEAAEQD